MKVVDRFGGGMPTKVHVEMTCYGMCVGQTRITHRDHDKIGRLELCLVVVGESLPWKAVEIY